MLFLKYESLKYYKAKINWVEAISSENTKNTKTTNIESFTELFYGWN